MNKKRTGKNIIFVLIILLICIFVFFGYYFITGKKNPLFGFIDKITEKKNIADNYNGIYTYYDDLGGSKLIFSGCSLSKIANHIYIIEDNYYTFRSSCMGSYLKETGKTEDLDIKLSEETGYYVMYKDKRYDKDFITTNITLNNQIAEKMKSIELGTYQIFMRETQFEGNYYKLEELKIAGINSDLRMSINRDDFLDVFEFDIMGKRNGKLLETIYSFNIKDINMLPDMYAYGKNIVLIEKGFNKETNRYNYNFKVVDIEGLQYNLYEKFPIIVDGVSLGKENSIYITFDSSIRKFRMLIGYDDKMCVSNYDESSSDDIVYYEFIIDYNYSHSGFDEPRFVKVGRKSEGCKYVNSIIRR